MNFKRLLTTSGVLNFSVNIRWRDSLQQKKACAILQF